jgi:DNA-binding NtrC family response regulator
LDAHGLGLPAVQLILSQLGGRITMETTEGHGTTITLVIPAATDDEVVDLSHAPDTILFIDEEDDPWALFAANVLKLAGKNVIVQAQPDPLPNADLILVDEALTTMPVADVLTALKNADAAEKTVVVTAATQVDRATTYFQQGIKDVALKPYTYLQLAAFLNTQKDKRSENAGQASE